MIQVYSEIGNLKQVLVHRPGNEIRNLHPIQLGEMLFEDTPYLPAMQNEHDVFTGILRQCGVEVVYLADLMREIFASDEVKKPFVEEYVAASHLRSERIAAIIKEYYLSLDTSDFVETIFTGIRRDHEIFRNGTSLGEVTYPEELFMTNPLPNAYFTRDSSVNVGDGVILSHMSKTARNREPIILRYIHNHASIFADTQIKDFYRHDLPYGIEGGDVVVLSDKAVVIGCTERTATGAIEYIGNNLLDRGFERIYAFEFPKARNFMHIDGLLTMIDYDKFLCMSSLNGNINIYKLTKQKGVVRTESVLLSWDQMLKNELGLDQITLIPCGNGDPISEAWESWNLGSNVLTIRPGEVVSYNRSDRTLELLDKFGIKVHTFAGAELSRGRGGPRCMSMPIVRER